MPLHYHVAGVAGVGMNAVAQALLIAGHEVSGSDRYLDQGRELDVLTKLRAAGVRLLPQDGSGVRSDTAALVVSTAVEEGNPDLAAAQRQGVPVVHRAAMLARLAAGRRLVAIAGTSGKTTVTGMTGWLLTRTGFDPTTVNGGNLADWRSAAAIGNVRPGTGEWWVVEADESDRSLLQFDPEWAVITNISKDHFELDEAAELFRRFARRVRQGIVCFPDTARALRAGAPDLPLIEIPAPDGGADGHFAFAGTDFVTPLPGRHNTANALLAMALCHALGAGLGALRDALADFHGIERRLERVGAAGAVEVFDDYAHNPAKINAAWTALARPGRPLTGVWRPHGFGPLALMLEELTDTFAALCRPGDRLYLLPVYYAGGTAARRTDSDELVRRLQARGVPAELAPDYAFLRREIPRRIAPGGAVLVMGARDPDLPLFARQLSNDLTDRPVSG